MQAGEGVGGGGGRGKMNGKGDGSLCFIGVLSLSFPVDAMAFRDKS